MSGVGAGSAEWTRGERWWRWIDARLTWCDGWMSRWLPGDRNPLARAGQSANAALLVAVATGVPLLFWYSPSAQSAHASLEALGAGTPGGWLRAMHRYSSDLAMLFVLLHAGRTFFARKFAGPRWLAWVTGVAMAGLVWLIGWTGYWLVWDRPAQQVAVSSIGLLDALPIFGEPLGRLFISDRTVPSLLFFVVFFLHLLLPLAIAVGLAVHLARLSRSRLLPGREMTMALVAALALASIIAPAPLDARAAMAEKAAALTVDAWYLSPLALSLRFQSAGLWVALFGGMALGAAIPWLLGRRERLEVARAVVTPERCHACTQCAQDCPFSAISMVARTDGRKFASQARVDPSRCVGCGVCAGSCDSGGIALGWLETRAEEERIEREARAEVEAGRADTVVLVAADIGGEVPELRGCAVWRVPTASWVRPSLIERLLATAGARGVLVVRDGSGEAWARDGGRWVEARGLGERAPKVRADRCAGGTMRVVDFDSSRPEALVGAVEQLRRGEPGPGGPGKRGIRLGGFAVAALTTALAVGPSHLRVENPASPEPELAIVFKAFGEMSRPAEVDMASEAAKPIHMRGRVTEKPRRAAVTVRITVDGVVEERTFAAKGVGHDGPAIGEWRRAWAPGDHVVAVEIVTGPGEAGARWEGRVRAEPRRIKVVSYDAAGFVVE